MRNPFRKPCICPVRMKDYLIGLRCQRHGDSTEAAMPDARQLLAAHHEASVVAKIAGVSVSEAWGMRCPVCAKTLSRGE